MIESFMMNPATLHVRSSKTSLPQQCSMNHFLSSQEHKNQLHLYAYQVTNDGRFLVDTLDAMNAAYRHSENVQNWENSSLIYSPSEGFSLPNAHGSFYESEQMLRHAIAYSKFNSHLTSQRKMDVLISQWMNMLKQDGTLNPDELKKLVDNIRHVIRDKRNTLTLQIRDLGLIPPFILRELISVSCVQIEQNHINAQQSYETIDVSSLKDLPNMNHLGISANLTKVPEGLEHLTSLTSLDLSYNNISDISPLCQLSHLKQLELNDNNISELPDDIKMLTNLERLELESNPLERLNSMVGALKSLNKLNVSDCYLQELPESLCHLSHLVYLDASYNELSQIPSGIENKTLYDLFLNGNNALILSDNQVDAFATRPTIMNPDLAQDEGEGDPQDEEPRFNFHADRMVIDQLLDRHPYLFNRLVPVFAALKDQSSVEMQKYLESLWKEKPAFRSWIHKFDEYHDDDHPMLMKRLVHVFDVVMQYGLIHGKELENQCLALIEEASNNCQDRALFSLGQLEHMVAMYTAKTPEEQWKVLEHAYHAQKLSAYAEEIDRARSGGSGQESVETALFALIHTSLPIGIHHESMDFERLSKISIEEVKQTDERIIQEKKNYFESMCAESIHSKERKDLIQLIENKMLQNQAYLIDWALQDPNACQLLDRLLSEKLKDISLNIARKFNEIEHLQEQSSCHEDTSKRKYDEDYDDVVTPKKKLQLEDKGASSGLVVRDLQAEHILLQVQEAQQIHQERLNYLINLGSMIRNSMTS
jgi:hypothetical protein